MTKPTHAHLQKLLQQLVLPFYQIERTIPLPIPGRPFENDAEHSWSLALLACSLAPEVDAKLDTGKICQFAVVHDLVEVYAGDTSHFGGTADPATKEEREAAAAVKIKQEFSFFPWIGATIEEYERKDTPEAQFVYAVDKYIAVLIDYLDQGVYLKEEKITLKQYNEILGPHRQKAHSHPEVGKYYDHVRELLNAHPEYFYQQ